MLVAALAVAAVDPHARDAAAYEAVGTAYRQCLETAVGAKPFLADGQALFARTVARCSAVESRLKQAEHRLWQYGIPENTGAGPYQSWALDKAYRVVACQKTGRATC